MSKITVKTGKQTQQLQGEDGQTVLQICLDNNLPIEHSCGGNGYCTTCQCTVVEGMDNLSEVNDNEEAMDIDGEDGRRLSCQCVVKGDIVVEFEE
jgi:ferredoxin